MYIILVGYITGLLECAHRYRFGVQIKIESLCGLGIESQFEERWVDYSNVLYMISSIFIPRNYSPDSIYGSRTYKSGHQ